MYILENVPLKAYSTMRLGGNARYLTDINSRTEVSEAAAWAEQRQLPFIMIGGGSNIFWSDEGYSGLVLVNKIMGFETFAEDEENLYVTVGAGEDWDSVVKRVVEMGFSGIEELSLIPGSAGATPIQNVGAYGREIAEVLTTVEAYDCQARSLVTIRGSDCGFAYRTSRFKTTDKGRFLITAVTLHVAKQPVKQPFYPTLQGYFDEHHITSSSPAVIREAVIAIRSSKLPDPAKVANNGSFFANPIVDESAFRNLQNQYQDIVYWEVGNGNFKLSAAWLMEQAGFKGVHDQETGMAIWPKHALVFVNEHAQSTADLLRFRQKVLDKIQSMFGISLQQEPELVK